MRRLLPLTLLILVFGAVPAWAAFDPSEYRQDTYGPPDHYCDPTRSLASNGTGTLGDPWNYTQCQTEPACGDVIGHLNVGSGTPVRLSAPNSFRTPRFQPDVSCTSGNPLVHVTRFAAVALPYSTITTNQLRTEMRHSGTAETVTGTGTGGAMYGSESRSYITYDGFFVDMAQAHFKIDSGVITNRESTGVKFYNFVVKGTNTRCESNCVIWRTNNTRDEVLSNFRVRDFDNDPTGGAVPQQGLFSDTYGSRNFLYEHFEIHNTDSVGIFLKGTAPAGVNFNYGTIRYGVVSGVNECFRFNDLDPSNVTTLEYNLCYDVGGDANSSGAGINLSSETTAARNILIHHNTVARVDSSSNTTAGSFYSRARGIGSNVIIRDNLFDIDNGPYGHMMDFGELATLPATLNFNGYTKNGASASWAYNGTEYTFNAWRTTTGRDVNSQMLSGTPFVGRASANFRVSPGHAAKTASSTGGEIGVYATSQIIGVDIGGVTAPTAPTNLRIVVNP
jgi:hypothetical protein